MARRENKKGWLLLGGAALLLLMTKAALAFNIKSDVTMPDTPEMDYALDVVTRVWAKYGRMATVTSGTEAHQPGDVHALGYALDFRMNDIPDAGQKLAMVNEVKAALGSDYYVLFEDQGLPNEHLHVQYQL